MDSFVALIIIAASITLVDIDNALYSSNRIGTLNNRRGIALLSVLGLEFIGRLFLLALFTILASEQEPLFTIFGFGFSIETLSLMIAGSYLLVSNGSDFLTYLRREGTEENKLYKQEPNMVMFLFKTALVLILMSVDTVLVITGQSSTLGLALFFLIFSAVVRLLFVDGLVNIMAKYPAIIVFVTVLLMAIGVELIFQGLGYDFEAIFNLLLILAILLFGGMQYRRGQRAAAGSSRKNS